MSVTIYCFDRRIWMFKRDIAAHWNSDPKRRGKPIPWKKYAESNNKQFQTPRSNMKSHKLLVNGGFSIAGVAKYIIRKAGNDKIHTLHLIAHGSPGQMQLGSGLTFATASQLSSLQGHFEPGGIIRIHGCQVGSDVRVCHPCGDEGIWSGSGGIGHRLLWAIANQTGAFVEAGINTQYPDAAFEIEGPSVTVTPNGSFGHSSGDIGSPLVSP